MGCPVWRVTFHELLAGLRSYVFPRSECCDLWDGKGRAGQSLRAGRQGQMAAGLGREGSDHALPCLRPPLLLGHPVKPGGGCQSRFEIKGAPAGLWTSDTIVSTTSLCPCSFSRRTPGLLPGCGVFPSPCCGLVLLCPAQGLVKCWLGWVRPGSLPDPQ